MMSVSIDVQPERAIPPAHAFGSVLILAPHTDDAELGCGGTSSRLLEEGAQIAVAAFSSAEESRPPGSEPGLLRREFMAAMKSMNVADSRARVFDFPVRRFGDHRQEILEAIVALRKQFEPDIIFIPAGSDVHQDHQVVHAEGLRAFKDRTVWGYELPWNQMEFKAQAFVTLERRHIESKWRALEAYRSQIELARPYFCASFIEGLARVRGVQVKAEYAEAFEVIRFKW
ncbi:MAG: PIG-L deacetylase family protein [Candidatus Acidiferrales bacterium]